MKNKLLCTSLPDGLWCWMFVWMFVASWSLVGFDQLFFFTAASRSLVFWSKLINIKQMTKKKKLVLYNKWPQLLSIHPHIAVLPLFVCLSDPNWCHCTHGVCLIHVWMPNRPFSKLIGEFWWTKNTVLVIHSSTEGSLADHCNELYYFAVCHCQVRSWRPRVKV